MNGQVSNVDTALVVSHHRIPPPAVAEVPSFSGVNATNMHHGQEITRIVEHNANFRPAVNQENGQVNANVDNSSCTKRRRELKSEVWVHFTKYEGKDGREWALCKHCENIFVGSSKSGTTHLKNHLERCQSKRNLSDRGANKSIEPSQSLTTLVVSKEKSKVDQELINHLDETREIMKYWGVDLVPMKDNIVNVYHEEKEKLYRYLTTLSCRFNLTIECLMGCEYLMVLDFIDDGWKLKKMIIRYLSIIDDGIENNMCSILDWKIEKSILSIVDNADYHSDEKLNELSKWLREQGSIPFDGVNSVAISWLAKHLRCNLNICAEGDLSSLLGCVIMFSRDRAFFQIAIDKLKSSGKTLPYEVVQPPVELQYMPRSFKCLEWAIKFKDVVCMAEPTIDFDVTNLKKELHMGTQLYQYMKELNDAGASLWETVRKCTTANVYFPVVCDIFLKLLEMEKSEYGCIRETASGLREKFFNKYWSKSNLVLAITAVLDPRFKMDMVQSWYKLIYGDEADKQLEWFTNYVTYVYNDYATGSNNSTSSTWGDGDGINSSTSIKMLDALGRPCKSSQCVSNVVTSPERELNCYLQDLKHPPVEDFDILAWWHSKSSTYPTLARMARDFLAIPISGFQESSLADEFGNVFDFEDLDDDIKQALICTKNWLWMTLDRL